MLSKEEINRINEILSCESCPTSYACEGCDITWKDKKIIREYIKQLEQEEKNLEVKMNKEEIEKAKEFMNNIKQTIQENNMLFGEENITIKAGKETAQNIEILLQYTDQQEKENNKLNKIIDEMVDEYEYNARCNLKNFCDEEIRKDKCIQDCRACIKQHFEKKVEEK